MDKIFIERTQEILLNRKQELENRLIRIKADLYHRNQAVDPDFEEQALERENEEVLEALVLEVEEELSFIDQALNRIRIRGYGTCRICGSKIPRQRLEAIPYASLCIECSEQEETLPYIGATIL